MSRNQSIARSLVRAIATAEKQKPRSALSKLLLIVAAFFTIYRLRFSRFRNDLFQSLRQDWKMDEKTYEMSFKDESELLPTGDMGYSGSTFFSTADEKFLVKSVPRHFEHSFFRDDLLTPYVEHMHNHLRSLLVRITDFLASDYTSLGGIIGLAPTHHIVMENLLAGKDQAQSQGGKKWQTFDLKPTSYFFPERDIAGGNLASDATKARLADELDDKMVLTRSQADQFLAQLEQDTKLLEQCNAVDYSLFLVRIPLSPPQNPFDDDADHDNAPDPPQEPPLAPPGPPTWRTGIRSADDRYVFRAVILDFFWAKHKVTPKVFTFLIKFWNLIDRGQGPMSITTTSEEYRTRFLKMCNDMIDVRE